MRMLTALLERTNVMRTKMPSGQRPYYQCSKSHVKALLLRKTYGAENDDAWFKEGGLAKVDHHEFVTEYADEVHNLAKLLVGPEDMAFARQRKESQRKRGEVTPLGSVPNA